MKKQSIIFMLAVLAGGFVMACDSDDSSSGCKPSCDGNVVLICDGDSQKRGDDCAASDKVCSEGKCVDSKDKCTGGNCESSGGENNDSCDAAACKAKTGSDYAGNICVDSYEDGQKECGCKQDSDCNSGFKCNTTMLICISGAGETCSATACAAVADDEYYGSVCVDSGFGDEMCGCVDNSGCKTGYTCNVGGKYCEKACSDSGCKAMTGDDYAGNVCVDGYEEGVKQCGCVQNSDCNSGYECNTTMMMCVKTEAGGTCEAAKCAEMSDDEYYGSACVDSDSGDKMCGCTEDSHCKNGYTCNVGGKYCERPCSDSACKAMTGDDYAGNVCVDGYAEGEKLCGCNSNTDCNSGYECNSTMMMCVKTEAGGTCEAAKCAEMSDDEYYGSACVDSDSGDKMCGCTEDSHCKNGYTCNTDGMYCEKTCSDSACKAMTGDDYAGNVCVDGYAEGEKLCGCNSNSDCNSGYECNSTMMMCVKSEAGGTCDAAACAAKTGYDYYGSACVDSGYGDKMCGCTEDSHCKTGYKCNAAGKNCVEEGGSQKKNLTLAFPTSSPLTCDKLKSKNTDIKDCVQDTGYTKMFTLTYKNDAAVVVRPSSYSDGRANLKVTGTDYIEFSNLSAGSSVAFTYQHGATGDSKRDNNTLKVADNKDNSRIYRAATEIASNTDINETFNMNSAATGFKMTHEGEGENVVAIKTVTITAP